MGITRDVNFTELSTTSWPKAATSRWVMVVVANLSTDAPSQMRTLSTSTLAKAFSQWRMLVQTPMAHNSSSASRLSRISMACTQYSEKLAKDLRYWTRWRNMDQEQVRPAIV